MSVPLDRTVEIQNRHPRLRAPAAQVREMVSLLDAARDRFEGGCPPGELSLVFLTDQALAQVHRDFMNDPTTTDVITFEGDPVAGLAGEICVSADTAAKFVGAHGNRRAGARGSAARRQAPALQRKFAAELTLYVVHGWLHLAGYDDLQPAKKRRMRAAEARAMKLLCESEALPEFSLR